MICHYKKSYFHAGARGENEESSESEITAGNIHSFQQTFYKSPLKGKFTLCAFTTHKPSQHVITRRKI